MLASHSLQEYQHLQAQMRMLYVGLSGDVGTCSVVYNTSNHSACM